MTITVADLHAFILQKPTRPESGVYLKLMTLPESIGGAVGSQILDINKLEVEDDGSITIIVEN